jgi:hypothetical protein
LLKNVQTIAIPGHLRAEYAIERTWGTIGAATIGLPCSRDIAIGGERVNYICRVHNSKLTCPDQFKLIGDRDVLTGLGLHTICADAQLIAVHECSNVVAKTAKVWDVAVQSYCESLKSPLHRLASYGWRIGIYPGAEILGHVIGLGIGIATAGAKVK